MNDEQNTTQEPAFIGFEIPRQNWFKIPNAFFDYLHIFTSQAEIAVVLYVMRHTWGYGDNEKRITLDEFMHGRKRKDGTRIDNGVGMAKTSIIRGLESAEKHGFIKVTIDDTDKARVIKTYAIATVKEEISGSETLPLEYRNATPNIERHLEKEKTPPNPQRGNAGDKEQSPLKTAVLTHLLGFKKGKTSDKTLNRRADNIVKALAELDVNETQLLAFVAWWGKERPNLTIPQNADSVLRNVSQWLNAKPATPKRQMA